MVVPRSKTLPLYYGVMHNTAALWVSGHENSSSTVEVRSQNEECVAPDSRVDVLGR